MELAIGSSAYKYYTYTHATPGTVKKPEKLSVGEGKLTQEIGKSQGRHFDAVSKYGDTLEISKEARNLLMGVEEQDTADSTEENLKSMRRTQSISTFDFSISDDRIYTNV